MGSSFEALIAEAESTPISGWDFGWLDGRATEERPAWRYASRLAERASTATKMLDLQAGDAKMLAELPTRPPLLVATEGYASNVVHAGRRLLPLGAFVVAANEDQPTLPFAGDVFDLVTSRHPVTTNWSEVARVLRPGGRYFSQQVGPNTMRELSEYLMGPLPESSAREPGLARRAANAAGLLVEDLRETRLRTTFNDIGAVVYFLRLVVWTVPDFTVDRYRDQLRALHDHIERDGPFVAHATRFLIEATKPRSASQTSEQDPGVHQSPGTPGAALGAGAARSHPTGAPRRVRTGPSATEQRDTRLSTTAETSAAEPTSARAASGLGGGGDEERGELAGDLAMAGPAGVDRHLQHHPVGQGQDERRHGIGFDPAGDQPRAAQLDQPVA